ncbi:hypothetical protein M885DRAFT_566144 [Pelagophyceae sp. CCMP2097]|nr:hypothetical protein M885DRAFT_566144 [Pelagophyceae sp. CCMP2097]
MAPPARLVVALALAVASGFSPLSSTLAVPSPRAGRDRPRGARPATPNGEDSSDQGSVPGSKPPQPEYDVEPFFADLQSPATLTVLGFGLIAFNFFVLANL